MCVFSCLLFLWPLSCLCFYDLWILITTLVSSNSSCVVCTMSPQIGIMLYITVISALYELGYMYMYWYLYSLHLFQRYIELDWTFSPVRKRQLRWYHTLQGDNSLKSVERFDHMMFVCRFQASR
jgi:hypothetical protein